MTTAYEFDYPPSSQRELAFRENNFQKNAPRDFSKKIFFISIQQRGNNQNDDRFHNSP